MDICSLNINEGKTKSYLLTLYKFHSFYGKNQRNLLLSKLHFCFLNQIQLFVQEKFLLE